VGGIFCDLEKAFDCINHDIVLAELKICGINGWDYERYKLCLEKGYQRMIMIKRYVVKSQVGLKYYILSHKLLFKDPYFFSCT
jgi:hypothetical protein